MHTCPVCGEACYCHGDIDDAEVEMPDYAAAHCGHYMSGECVDPEEFDYDEEH